MDNKLSKPVAWEMRYWNSGYHIWGDWERITAEQHAEMSVKYATDNDYEFRVLYDAPAAPAVPDEAYSDDCPNLYPSQPDAWAAGFNTCRAEMLAAAPEGAHAYNALK
ncbi:hypothetical protein I5R25_05965 [Serratia marcescens]|nr:hypothetical protein [Serratia marcescens]